MIFDETIVHYAGSTNPAKYGVAVLNPDGSLVGGGSAQSTPYTMQAYYNSDATYEYEYYCEANPGTPLANALWRVFRVRTTVADGKFYDKTWAGILFNNAATDLATVEAYTYS